MKLKRKKQKSIDLKPVIALSVIALLLIGFIYWSERAAAPVKQHAAAPVKHAAVPVKTAAHPPSIAKIESKTEPKIEKKISLPPPAVTVHKGPKVAIVIDDFGYNMNNLEAFFGIKMPITLAVLPRQHYSRKIAESARSRGYEVILHLPLEPRRPNAKEEADTIRPGMSDAEITARLKEEIADVPGLSGVSNHQGSKATEDKQVMADVLKYLKKNDLYFFDSFTTPRSVCREAASEAGVRYVRRSKFLDNNNDAAAIEKQLAELKTMAIARGSAIAIGHDRKTTVAVLAKVMPKMAKEGIEFVYLSDMVK